MSQLAYHRSELNAFKAVLLPPLLSLLKVIIIQSSSRCPSNSLTPIFTSCWKPRVPIRPKGLRLVPEVSNLRPIYALNSGGRTQKVSRITHMRMLKALALFLSPVNVGETIYGRTSVHLHHVLFTSRNTRPSLKRLGK